MGNLQTRSAPEASPTVVIVYLWICNSHELRAVASSRPYSRRFRLFIICFSVH